MHASISPHLFISSSLHRFIASSLHRIIASSHYRFIALSHYRILPPAGRHRFPSAPLDTAFASLSPLGERKTFTLRPLRPFNHQLFPVFCQIFTCKKRPLKKAFSLSFGQSNDPYQYEKNDLISFLRVGSIFPFRPAGEEGFLERGFLRRSSSRRLGGKESGRQHGVVEVHRPALPRQSSV